MLYSKYLRNFVFAIAVFFFPSFASSIFSFSQTTPIEKASAIFILKGNTRFQSGKSCEGVDLELKKNGQTVTKTVTGKNGKYYLQLEVSTTNKKNEYLLYISHAGTIPKSMSINTYIPSEEFTANGVPRYQFDLEIKMIETTIKDIVVERPSGKIIWDDKQHAFAFDQTYAKIMQMEEKKLKDDPDKLLKETAEKKKKEEEEIAKKKAEEEAKRIADQKGKEEADRVFQQNLEAMKQEMKRKRMADSIAALEAAKTKVVIQKFVKPVSPEDVDHNAFDGTTTYSINIAKKYLNASKEKTNKEKAKNLSAKYETNNTLTSLLNVVDEHDKKMKKQ